MGLPAKSGVSGCVMVVVPNLLVPPLRLPLAVPRPTRRLRACVVCVVCFGCVQGMCIWSPRIDDQGNSVRAVEFCKQLTSRYAFHVFDDVISCSEVRLLSISISFVFVFY